MEHGCRNSFIVGSRTEHIEDYALDAFEEICEKTIEGFDALTDSQRGIVFDAVEFGARAACILLGETGTYEQEYQTMLSKLREQGNA